MTNPVILRCPACHLLVVAIFGTCSAAAWSDTSPPVTFRKHIVDADFANGYQVSTADLDADGDLDIIALSTDPSQLVWYRNPDWARYTISTRTERNIDCAAHEVDGDGDADLAVASDFDLGDSRKGGTLQWLENPGDPATTQEWAVHYIEAIPTSHRVRWADIDGDGRKELVNLPIIGVGAAPPDYAVGLRFRAYRVPTNPATEPWASVPIDDTLCMAHGLSVAGWDYSARPDLFTASFDGVHHYRWKEGVVVKTRLGVGNRGVRPAQGSSEVGIGHLGADGARFVATIEPWHGNEVVVYAGLEGDPLPWPRRVIDSSLADGHGLVCVDADGDGADEIVAGGRDGTHELLLFRWNGASWQRQIIDPGGVAVAGLTLADINEDGRPDLVATGTSTHNVVWYENRSGLAE